MVNYACAFSQSESGKYFEWIIITCISVLHHQGPVHTYLFLFEWTDIIFSTVWPTVHTYLVKTVTENTSFQKRSPEWRFLKRPASSLSVNGRKRRLCNAMMSSYFYHHACSVRDPIVFPSFQRAKTIRIFFWKQRNRSGYVWTGPKIQISITT